MAFRRFVSLRGNPNNCWSDCGTNFIGAQHYLKELLNDWDIPRIQSVVSEESSSTFRWSWNVPRASHQNRIVESQQISTTIVGCYVQKPSPQLFKQLERRSLKQIRASTGFEPVTSALPMRCSTN